MNHRKPLLQSLIGAAALLFAAAAIHAQDASHYVWRNVKVGGGGFVPIVVFSPVERNLAYLGSDMGGAYRWDASAATWVPIEDGLSDPNLRGVESIVPDPKDANTVYAAVGTYHAFPAAIIKSKDRGQHWAVTPVPFRMGGNEDGRGMGPRLAVDPNDTSVLYFASRYDGLQKSTDGGVAWTKVGTFPLKGLRLPDAREKPRAGLSFVVFDPTSGSNGTPTRTLFVGVADPAEHHLYRSDDGGQTWQAVNGGPDAGLLAMQARINRRGILYITYSNAMGPNGITDGAVFKLDTHTGAWTDITPDKNPKRPHGGYFGLALDPERDGTVLVATIDRREAGDTIWRTSDGGDHWIDLRPLSQMDVSATPFLLFGEKKASFGWWQIGMAVDPFNSNHAAYTTGATIYATDTLLRADTREPITWKPWVEGVEQTAILSLTSPPVGPHLVSGFGDIGGFTHFDLTKSEPMFDNPVFVNTNTIDYAGRQPTVIVRSGTHADTRTPARTATLGYSLDSGRSWVPLFAPAPAGYKPPSPISYNYSDPYTDAAIILSADGKRFMVMTPPTPVITADRGKTWVRVKGLPKGFYHLDCTPGRRTLCGAVAARPVADRVDPKSFYAIDFATGRVYASRDGGFHFRHITSRGLPDISADQPYWREMPFPLMATPGKVGDLWFVSHQGLFHSSDGGRTFVRKNGDVAVAALAFGKAPPGKDYPALFAIGTRGTTTAIWRSDDQGSSWVRVNDAEHEYGRAFRCIAGDPRVFGRVYVGTDGRGVVYGEPEQ